ncbi:OmpA family protein [Cereibacter sphaeroides]|uniref:OmpA family protein n=1 Tax=Cereibacter sphaeroides TaxID=1063 RepID=UPI003990D1F8
MIRQLFLAALILCPGAAAALELGAPWTRVERQEEASASYRLPTGPWTEAGLPVRPIEGRVVRSVWQRDLAETSTLDLLTPLRAALEAEGFRPLFQCETRGCGGFDFRYATDVLPEPEMHLDLGDFRFFAAIREGAEGPEAVSLLISRSDATGFVQVIEALPRTAAPPAPVAVPDEPVAAEAPAPAAGTLIPRLEETGAAVLEELVFGSGSAELEDRAYPALADLAQWLKEDPARRVVIVGHTDASGGLEGNVTLSRARAVSVRERLIARHGVDGAQVTADGVGYLAPRATNRTEEGRARNRRVEVMLLAG